MAKHLSEAQQEQILEILRASPGKQWISRGRNGDGLVFTGECFATLYVEDNNVYEMPLADDAAFLTFLARIDLSSFSSRYWRSIFQGMGVL